ncbi:hypothetical protein Glove_199g162 [Diversispora epigaea]|uniref:Uncharacterized protein n=1 Tax=Diversispora epigaea TaxID=1348612 RepID=A0A397ITM4_9GLOM|nr:hypothetical protein Glove_199g162 [Diversispora epigaea]
MQMETLYSNENETINIEEEEFRQCLKLAEGETLKGGNHMRQNNLGYYYQNGIGTIKDEGKVFRWYLKSTEGGSSNGQVNLGNYEGKAFQWYLKSAEGGNHKGQINLGIMLSLWNWNHKRFRESISVVPEIS